mmetsp:Transcript_3537/g.8518  ORF Transcript_3537/g.8518 Transcript_3537/m.8518 type:complete len:617 (-) Transcript_3537:69-1919(-)
MSSQFAIENSLSGHSFAPVTFHRPTRCAHCERLVWGIREKTCQCSRCKYSAHVKCVLLNARELVSCEEVLRSSPVGSGGTTSSASTSRSTLARKTLLSTTSPNLTTTAAASTHKNSLKNHHTYTHSSTVSSLSALHPPERTSLEGSFPMPDRLLKPLAKSGEVTNVLVSPTTTTTTSSSSSSSAAAAAAHVPGGGGGNGHDGVLASLLVPQQVTEASSLVATKRDRAFRKLKIALQLAKKSTSTTPAQPIFALQATPTHRIADNGSSSSSSNASASVPPSSALSPLTTAAWCSTPILELYSHLVRDHTRAHLQLKQQQQQHRELLRHQEHQEPLQEHPEECSSATSPSPLAFSSSSLDADSCGLRTRSLRSISSRSISSNRSGSSASSSSSSSASGSSCRPTNSDAMDRSSNKLRERPSLVALRNADYALSRLRKRTLSESLEEYRLVHKQHTELLQEEVDRFRDLGTPLTQQIHSAFNPSAPLSIPRVIHDSRRDQLELIRSNLVHGVRRLRSVDRRLIRLRRQTNHITTIFTMIWIASGYVALVCMLLVQGILVIVWPSAKLSSSHSSSLSPTSTSSTSSTWSTSSARSSSFSSSSSSSSSRLQSSTASSSASS